MQTLSGLGYQRGGNVISAYVGNRNGFRLGGMGFVLGTDRFFEVPFQSPSGLWRVSRLPGELGPAKTRQSGWKLS